jgi:hypothetical protein
MHFQPASRAPNPGRRCKAQPFFLFACCSTNQMIRMLIQTSRDAGQVDRRLVSLRGYSSMLFVGIVYLLHRIDHMLEIGRAPECMQGSLERNRNDNAGKNDSHKADGDRRHF